MIKIAHIGGISISRPAGGIDVLTLEIAKRTYLRGLKTIFYTRDHFHGETRYLSRYNIEEVSS